MKKNAIALVFILIMTGVLLGQEYWYWQNPLPQGNELNDCWMFDSRVIVAVGDVGTVIKTTNGGDDWTVSHYTSGITGKLLTLFFIDPNTGWAGGANGKVLKTTNGGLSWSVLATLDSIEVRSMFFQDGQSGWAVGTKVDKGDQKGVILTTVDGGLSWKIEDNTGAAGLNWIKFFSANLGWAVGSRYQQSSDIILRTEDGGKNWTPYYSGLTTELYRASFVDNLHGWAVGKGTTASGVIIHTEDGGVTWTAQTHPLATKFFWAIAFKNQNLGWAVGEGGSMLKTEDGGGSWKEVTNQSRRNLKAIGFADPQIVMAMGNAGLIIKSDDDGTVWHEVSTGTTTWHFYAVDFTDPDTGWIVGPNKTILKSVNGGMSWKPQSSSAPQNLLDINMVDNLTGWTVGEWGVILKTTNGGDSDNWIEQTSGTTNFLHSCFFLNDQMGWICGGPVTGDSSIILHTADGGDHWARQNCSANASLRAIQFTDEQRGWTVGENGNVFRTVDGGNNWTPVDLGTSADFYSVYFLSKDIGWIGGSSILHTADGGNTWIEQKAFSSIDQVRAIKFIDLLIGWATIQGSAGALYKTMDGGLDWFKLDIGTNNNLYDIDIVEDQMAWVVGTYSTILKTDAVVVPVELAAFEATWNHDRVQLSWSTASESNNYGFEVQRNMGEQANWVKVGFVEGHGTTDQSNYYSWLDCPEGGGKYRYRLKQLDLDGKFRYSPIREVMVPIKFALYQNHPNPFNPATEIGFELSASAVVTLEIYNTLGQKIMTLINEHRPAGFQKISWKGTDDFGRLVGSGVYFYRIKAENFEATRKLLILR